MNRQIIQEHVRFILVAEFDIDQGSVIKHQYPYPVTPADNHALAELMLPDGAHLHKEDHTVFYLNQVPANTVRDILQDNDSTASTEGAEKNDILYVLNAVMMKEDKALRRGAEVKAIAICTPHPWIQAYQRLLILSLEDYFKSPTVDVLEKLFDALNGIDTSAMPLFSRNEKLILRASERRDLLENRFREALQSDDGDGLTSLSKQASSHSSDLPSGSGESDSVPALPSNVIPFPSSSLPTTSKGDTSPSTSSFTRAHSRIDSVASASRFSISSLSASTDSAFGLSRSSTPSRDSYNSQRLSKSTPDFRHANHGKGEGAKQPLQTAVGRTRKGIPKDTRFFETFANFEGMGVPFPVQIPLTLFEEEVGEFSLIALIKKFSPATPAYNHFSAPFLPSLHTSGPTTHPIILLFNALITHRRIIFLGHGREAGAVATMVLAACALGSGSGSVLRGFTARCFPYANLAGLDMLEQVPGFIAGVTNPRFEDLHSRWDVLCNIDTGRITVSKDIKPDPPLPGPASTFASTFTPTNVAGFSSTSVGNPVLEETGAIDSTLAEDGNGPSTVGAEFGALPGVSDQSTLGGGTIIGEKGKGRQSRSDSVAAGGKGSLMGAWGDTDAAFMEEIISLINHHYGEPIIRARFAEYIHRFIRLASRYEEETYAPPPSKRIWYPSLPSDVSKGRLGSGAVLWEGELSANQESTLAGAGPTGRRRESDATDERRAVKTFVGSNGVRRIESWRATTSYRLWKEDFDRYSPTCPLSFDLAHQLSRLRNARMMSVGEAELIFKTLGEEVKTYDQVVEVLAQTPMSRGGLIPFASGLFHKSHHVKASTLDFFDTLQRYPIGKAFLLQLNAFHRLAYTRLSDERRDAVRARLDAESSS